MRVWTALRGFNEQAQGSYIFSEPLISEDPPIAAGGNDNIERFAWAVVAYRIHQLKPVSQGLSDGQKRARRDPEFSAGEMKSASSQERTAVKS